MCELRGFLEPRLPAVTGRVGRKRRHRVPRHSAVYCDRGRWEVPSGEGSMSLLSGNLIVAASKFALLARGLSNAGHRRGDHERGTLVSTQG